MGVLYARRRKLARTTYAIHAGGICRAFGQAEAAHQLCGDIRALCRTGASAMGGAEGIAVLVGWEVCWGGQSRGAAGLA